MATRRNNSDWFSFRRLMLEGSFGVFMAVFIFSVILVIFTDGFLRLWIAGAMTFSVRWLAHYMFLPSLKATSPSPI